MDEKRLLWLLDRGGLQLRLNEGLRWGCGAALLAVIGAAFLVLLARLKPEWAPELLGGSWLLGVLVPLAGWAGFWGCRPAQCEVALHLDRRGSLQEHLSTWEEIRRRGLPEDAVARGLALLQDAATRRLAEGLRPARLIPLALPVWRRALWLAFPLLGCAVLMPEQRAVAERRMVSGEGEDDLAGGVASIKPLTSRSLGEAFDRIEVLTQSEKEKLAIVCGKDVPEVLKGEVLSEIEAKLGGLSERELGADVREWLAELRRQVRGPEAAVPNTGSATVTAPGIDDDPSSNPAEVGINVLARQETVALVRERFPDVADALQRYYLAK